MRTLTIALMLLFSSVASADNKVVVIPMGDTGISASDCPPQTSMTIAGPVFLYDYCWYLGGGGISCDTVCGSLKGANLAYLAEDEWSDSCLDPTRADVTTYFYNHGNPGNWTVGGSTTYRTLGHGYLFGLYFGKCITGGDTAGVYPGEIPDGVNWYSRLLVCPCAGVAKP